MTNKEIQTKTGVKEKEGSRFCRNGCRTLRIYCPTEGAVLNQLTIAIGRALPCTRVTLKVDGRTAAQTYTDSCGHWQVSLHQMLSSGTHTLSAAAGCSSADQVEFIIDGSISPVPVPVIDYPEPLIDDPNPLIRGTARPGDSVRVCVDGDVCGTAAVDENGTWSIQSPVVLEDGLHIVTAAAIGPDGRESIAAYQIFRYHPRQVFSVTLDAAHEGHDFRTIALELAVTGYVYPVTLHYLLLPPGSPAPSKEDILHYTGSGLEDGTAAAGSISISAEGKQTVDISGLEQAPREALGLVDGYRYDVYLIADNGEEQSPVQSAMAVRAMPFAGGSGLESDPYLIRQLTREEIAQKYPDLSADRSPIGVDETAHLLQNIENMELLFQESGGKRGVRNSMGLDYQLVTPLNLIGYAAANEGQGWTALGYKNIHDLPMRFSGSLSGESEKTPIQNLTIIRDSIHRYEGLFACGSNAYFKDLALENVTMILDASQNLFYGDVHIGALTALLHGGVLTGITISGVQITLTGTYEIEPFLGGIAGEITDSFTARSITGKTLRISAKNDWYYGVTGSLFGRLDSIEHGTITIEDVTVTGSTVTGWQNVGGFAGEIRGFRTLRNISVRNSFISGENAVGGLTGYLEKGESDIAGLIEGIRCEGNTIYAESSYASGMAAYTRTKALNVRDSHVSDCTLKCGEGDYGGFLGYINIYDTVEFNQCSVENCRISGTQGNFSVAGFAGTIENEEDSTPRFLQCTVRDTEIYVEGDGFRIAGFVGYLLRYQGGTFNQCHVIDCIIRSTSTDVGGFAGEIELWNHSSLIISNCSVQLAQLLSCDRNGGIFTGQIYAYNDGDIRFENCAGKGVVECIHNNAGGFIGRCSKGVFIRCQAIGNIKAENYLGGFGGCLSDTALKECFFSGEVNAEGKYSGGLAGQLGEHCLVEDCYASGSLYAGHNMVGGIFGTADSNVTVKRCYSQGMITGKAYTGGIAGHDNGSIISIEDSLVLSSSISGAFPTGRVIGSTDDNINLHNNYSTTTQILQDQVQKPIIDNPGGQDGATIAASQITDIIRLAGWSDTIWDYSSISSGMGPKLLNNPERT